MRQTTISPTAAATAEADLQPMGLVLGALSRWVLPIVAMGLLGAFAALVLLKPGGTDSAEATGRLGLTDEVVWPFYDAARDRVDITATAPEFLVAVEETCACDIDAIRVDIPTNQAYVDLVVEDTDEAEAIAGLDAAIVLATEQSVTTQQLRLQADVDVLVLDIADAETAVEDLTVQIDELLTEQVQNRTALITAPGDATLLRRSSELDLLRSRFVTERDSLLRDQLNLESDLAEAQRRLNGVQAEVELLRRSSSTSTPGSGLAIAIAVGVVAAGGMALLSLIADREFGKIRHPWYLSGPAQLPVLGTITRDKAGDYQGLAASVDRLLDRLSGRIRIVGVIGDSLEADKGATGRRGARILVDGLDLVDFRTITIIDSADGTGDYDLAHPDDIELEPGTTVVQLPANPSLALMDSLSEQIDKSGEWLDTVVIDIDPDYIDDDQLRLRTRLCDMVVVIASSKTSRVRSIRGRAERVREAGGVIVGALLVKADR